MSLDCVINTFSGAFFAKQSLCILHGGPSGHLETSLLLENTPLDLSGWDERGSDPPLVSWWISLVPSIVFAAFPWVEVRL